MAAPGEADNDGQLSTLHRYSTVPWPEEAAVAAIESIRLIQRANRRAPKDTAVSILAYWVCTAGKSIRVQFLTATWLIRDREVNRWISNGCLDAQGGGGSRRRCIPRPRWITRIDNEPGAGEPPAASWGAPPAFWRVAVTLRGVNAS